MLLQLTSVLNYFTCDLRYFLRKSVRYLLKDNKINLPCCPFTFLSVVLSLFPFFVPLYCVPHTVVLLSVADLVLLIMLMCFAFFWSGDNFLPFIRNAVGQTANRLGLCGLLGVFPFLCLLIPLTFYCALPSFFLSSDIQFSSFHFPLMHFQVGKNYLFPLCLTVSHIFCVALFQLIIEALQCLYKAII